MAVDIQVPPTGDLLGPKPVKTFLDADISKTADPAKLAFDPEALKRRYTLERDKRKAEANAHGNLNQFQLIEANGEFAGYLRDPWVEPGFERDAIKEQVDVFILGGGYSAQIIAARLLEGDITKRIRMVDKAGDFGGTWFDSPHSSYTR